MRNRKRIMAFILSLVLVLAECMPAMASELIVDNDELIAVDEVSEDILVDEAVSDEDILESEVTHSDDAVTEDIFLEDESVKTIVISLSDNEITDKTSEESASLFPGLGSFDELSAEQLADKANLEAHSADWRMAASGVDFVEDEIIVSAETMEEAEKYAKAFNGKVLDCEYGSALIELNAVEGAPKASVLDAVYASANPEVALPAVWPNYLGSFDAVEEPDKAFKYDDPFLVSEQTNDMFYQYQHSLMQSDTAWRAGYTGQGVKVAVLDSGVNGSHEDLALTGHAIFNNTTKNIDTVALTSNSDEVGHGTHCVGIVGARANNGKGGAGIAPNASMYMIRTSDEDQRPDTYGTTKGINYAVSTWGVNVISMSLGFKGYSPDMENAVNNAYNNGVAVFTSSGNDNSNMNQYPSGFDKAISVGAVDANNTIAYFSDCNSKVRYTGPGVSVPSTGYDPDSPSNSLYVIMSGTSMACPATAGAAAVLLSSGKVTGTGGTKVDNLLALMDKGAVSAGAGGGKGTVNLAKALGLAASNTAPKVPVATIATTQPIKALSVAVDIASAESVFYTIDGSNPTIYSTPLSVSSGHGTIILNADDDNKVVLKLFAINSNGLRSKTASYTYKFAPYVNALDDEYSLSTGAYHIVKGTSATIKTVAYPVNAANKSLSWELVGTPVGVTVSNTGKIAVKKDSTATSVTVKATSKDNAASPVSKAYTVPIMDPSAVAAVNSIKTSITSATIYNEMTVEFTADVTMKDGSHLTASELNWYSSNIGVADIYAVQTDGKVIVAGYGKGTATITGYARDGSGKKAAVKINVKQQLKQIDAVGPLGVTGNIIAKGKSIPLTVKEYNPENATSKKLVWKIVGTPSSTTVETCGVTINAGSGKVAAKKTAVSGTYTAVAYAADGQGAASNPVQFTVVDSLTSSVILANTKARMLKGGIISVPITSVGCVPSALSVKVSNDELIGAVISGSNLVIYSMGSIGNAKVTVAATDGSNAKATCDVTIYNKATSVRLSPPRQRSAYIAAGKTLKLTPAFGTDNGPIDAGAKKLTWTSSHPSLVTVDQKGTVKNITATGSNTKVTITATTEDGVYGTFNVIPVGTVTGVKAFYSTTYNGVILTVTGRGLISYDYWVDISAPEVWGAFTSTSGSTALYSIYANGSESFNKKITFKFKKMDGSGKSCSASYKLRYNK